MQVTHQQFASLSVLGIFNNINSQGKNSKEVRQLTSAGESHYEDKYLQEPGCCCPIRGGGSQNSKSKENWIWRAPVP